MTCEEALVSAKAACADLDVAIATRWRALWYVLGVGVCGASVFVLEINGLGIAVLAGAATFCWLTAGDYQRDADAQRAVARARCVEVEAHWDACPTCRVASRAAGRVTA